MSRKIIVALWAFALLIVTAWADTSVGGEGGCINLPGGRTSGGSRPNSVGGELPVAWQATGAISAKGLLLRLPDELYGAAGALHAHNLPITAVYGSVDGYLRLPAAMMGALRMGDTGFTLVLRAAGGESMAVCARFVGGADVVLTVL